jgi:hypothetical protein
VTPDLRREVVHLVSALCDGDLPDPDRGRLDRLLAADPECRRLYLEVMDLHAGLLARPGRFLPTPPSPARNAGRRRLAAYAVVAACTLAVSLLAQLAWRPGPGPGGGVPADGPGPAADYVATLTYAVGCDWEPGGDPPHLGARLAPGEARLRKGLARIRFDSGADLLIEGPARFRLNGPGSATVWDGKVVFRADETATPFDLRTPTASLVDFGTEYAVAVGPGGEEVHVFEGEVRRTPYGDPPAPAEQLVAGQAWRYETGAGDPGRQTPLDPGRFVRRPPDPAAPAAGGLLAYEGFDYHDPDDLPAGRASGGLGWDGPWVFGFARPVADAPPAPPPLNVREGLLRPGSVTPAVGGSFDYAGFTKAFRKLKVPVRLDADGVYYLSYLFRHHGPPADPVNAVAVLLWPDADARAQDGDRQRRLNIGVGGANQVFTHLQGVGSRTPLPLSYGETYLLVAKIVAGRDRPDQVFIRVYAPLEPVEHDESDGWSVTGPPFQSDLTFDWVQLHVNSGRRQTIDEFRLGTTWASVTAPWVRAPEAKK